MTNSGSPAAFTTTYAFDPDGALTTTTDPLGHVTSYGYDANHNQTTVTDPLGHVTTSTFDADNEVTTVTRADGTTVTTTYDGDGHVTGQTDGLHNTTTYTYDALGRVSATHDPLGRVTTVGYDPAGRPVAKTDATGLVTTVAFDAAGQRTSIHYSDTATPSVSFTYNVTGQRASMTDATGVTNYTYDALNRLTGQTDGAGQVVSYGYDLAGHVTALTYPNAQVVTRGYDDAGRLHTITDWLGHTTTLGLDPDSNRASTVYGNGVTSAATFNNADQMTATTDTGPAGAALASFTYTRDSNGQLTSTTPTGVTQGNETYPYTPLNQLAGVGTSTYTYDAADNITRLLNGNTLSYDAANQPTTATPTTGPATTFSYDQRGNRTNATTVAAATMSVDVTKSKDSTSSTNPTVTTGTFTTTATNEVLLALVSSDGPAGAPQTETVAGAGLTWTLVTRANTQAGDAEIWKATAPTVLTGVSVRATQSVSGFHQTLTVVAVKGATGVGASAHASAPTGAPTLTLTTTAPGSLVFATGHDWDSATARTLGAGQSLVHEFSDAATRDDSWVQRTTNPVPATATAVTVNDTAPTTNRWDLTAVEITAPPTAPAVAAFTYNQANELTASTTPAGVTAGYTYDGDGLRATRTTPATTQKFAWALSGGLPVLLTDATLSYVYDDNGTPIEQIDTAGVALYYQHDQYGSTRLLTDAAGAVAATFSYDPYGNLTGHTGTADTPLRWNGQYQDTDTALYYLRARYYDPTTAQFITRDPLVATTRSPYAYGGEDPNGASDPLGLATLGACGNVGLAFGVRTLSGSGCLVRTVGTGSDEIGFEETGAAGWGVGANAGGGIGVQVSNANSLSDLTGPFAFFSLAGEYLEGAYLTLFAGRNAAGQLIYGLDIGVNFGAGAEVSGGISNTWVQQLTGWSAVVAKLVWDSLTGSLGVNDLLGVARSALIQNGIVASNC